jgi:hypothetical protein
VKERGMADAFRGWDEQVDGREISVRKGPRTYKRLRGHFVAADRRFNVIVRSGLSRNKQAFLSCS